MQVNSVECCLPNRPCPRAHGKKGRACQPSIGYLRDAAAGCAHPSTLGSS